MTRHRIAFTINTEMDIEQLQALLVKVLEKKLNSTVLDSEVKSYGRAGRRSINRPIIEEYMVNAGNTPGLKFTVEEIVEATELPEQAVSKWLRRMRDDGFLVRHYQVGSGVAEWELVNPILTGE